MAYQLKKRGHNVTIIDKESGVAQKVSGNLKAILYSKPQKKDHHLLTFMKHNELRTTIL